MAMLFMDSFDHYDQSGSGTNPSGTTQKWDYILTTPTTNTGLARTGARCMRCNANQEMGKIIHATGSNSIAFTAGFAFMRESGNALSSNTTICCFKSNSTTEQLSLCMTSTGLLHVRQGSASGTLLSTSNAAPFSTGSYHYIEFKGVMTNGAAGSYEVRVDGSAIAMDAANPRSSVNTAASAVGCTIFSIETDNVFSSGSFLYDDLIVHDDQGGVNNGFLGDLKVNCVLPTVDGNWEVWDRSTGTDSWELVNDPQSSSPCPNGDTDYISTTNTAANTRSSFTFTAISSVGGPKAVQCTTSSKTDTGSATVNVFTRIGGTDYEGTGAVVGATTYTMLNDPATSIVQGKRTIWDNSPATNTTWTLVELNGAEFGVRRTA